MKLKNHLVIKAVIYRIVRVFIVFLSGIFILNDPTVALTIAGVHTIVATLFYWYYDSIWPTINKKINYVERKWKYRRLDT